MKIQDRILALQQLVDREGELMAALQQKRGELVQAISRELLAGGLRIEDHRHGQ